MVREFSNLIMRRRAKDDRLGLVSVTGVELAADLSKATIKVSLFGSDEENRDTWAGLEANLGFFQTQVGKNLRLRHTPRMNYQLDTSVAEGDRIISLIDSESRSADEAGATMNTGDAAGGEVESS